MPPKAYQIYSRDPSTLFFVYRFTVHAPNAPEAIRVMDIDDGCESGYCMV